MAKRALFLLSLFVLACCATRQDLPVLEANQPFVTQLGRDEIATHSPFNLAILEDYYDGARLFVKGEIGILKPGQSIEDVAVRLITINDGGFHESKYYSIDEVAVSKGESDLSAERFLISMNVGDLSEYQVELVWGQEAAEVLRQRRPAILKSVEIRGIEVTGQRQECFFEPCEVAFELEADLINTGETIIDKAILGLGFVLEASQSRLVSPLVPDQEETVQLSDLNLLPGQSKPLRLTFEQTVQESMARKLRPNLRLISFE
jgi:hypothetical protein